MSRKTRRTIAIGDIHGYSAALDGLLAAIAPQADDVIVALGDFVGRGPDSPGVLDRLIRLAGRCRLVPILGNHDEMFLEICEGKEDLMPDWLLFGGDTTYRSYGREVPDGVPAEHVAFLKHCPDVFETETHFFVHGNYLEQTPLDKQPTTALRWESIRDRQPEPHVSGKTAMVGHTSQKDGEILDLGHLVCIDTYIYGDGWLTAMDVDTKQIWQVDQEGQLRSAVEP